MFVLDCDLLGTRAGYCDEKFLPFQKNLLLLS